ncbi:MAG: phosphoribosylamine--glycine ligase [Candidatus Acetothermia bacterium]
MRNVLVVGSGGREHALCEKLKVDQNVGTVFCAPGNGGIASSPGLEQVSYDSAKGLYRKVRDYSIDLVVVGPEKPLAEGLGDFLREKGVKVFGFSTTAAKLESSKVFADRFKSRHQVASPDFEFFNSFSGAQEYLESIYADTPGEKFWVKADELCGGKGAIGISSLEQGREALTALFKEKKCGEGESVVIQEHVTGQELTIQTVTDGDQYLLLPSSQDHKAVYNGGKGPNTGGMGAYAPAPLFNSSLNEAFQSEVLRPTAQGMEKEEIDSQGVLYFGLMVSSKKEPRVLEYNVRFGDPEAQVVLELLETDLYPILRAASVGSLSEILDHVSWRNQAAVIVILAVEGYPVDYGGENLPIEGLSELEDLERVSVYHAGTRYSEGNLYTAGGRVLGITARAETIPQARERAYDAVDKVRFKGMHYRTDIAQGVS